MTNNNQTNTTPLAGNTSPKPGADVNKKPEIANKDDKSTPEVAKINSVR